mgnify:CR=1 FL=1
MDDPRLGDCPLRTIWGLSPASAHATHGWRMSSHRKNGPPMSAVTMPTGSSSGASAVRETRSHATRNAAPKPSDAGTTSAMVGPDEQPDEMRDDDADEADRSADRHGRARGKRGAEKRDALHAHDGDPRAAARSSPSESRFSDGASAAKTTNDRPAASAARHHQRPVAGDVQIAQQPRAASASSGSCPRSTAPAGSGRRGTS